MWKVTKCQRTKVKGWTVSLMTKPLPQGKKTEDDIFCVYFHFFSLGDSNMKQQTCSGKLQNLSPPPTDLLRNICWLKRKIIGKINGLSTEITFSFKKPRGCHVLFLTLLFTVRTINNFSRTRCHWGSTRWDWITPPWTTETKKDCTRGEKKWNPQVTCTAAPPKQHSSTGRGLPWASGSSSG